MSPEEIRRVRGSIADEIEELKFQIEQKRHALKGVQIVCKHPTPQRTGDYSGASYSYCPDCGKEPL